MNKLIMQWGCIGLKGGCLLRKQGVGPDAEGPKLLQGSKRRL